MRLLLDHCVPRTFTGSLIGHDVETARQRGWDALEDGDLLDRICGEFEGLITVDRNLRWQQNMADRPFFILVLIVRRNTIRHLALLVPQVLAAIANSRPGEVLLVGDAVNRSL